MRSVFSRLTAPSPPSSRTTVIRATPARSASCACVSPRSLRQVARSPPMLRIARATGSGVLVLAIAITIAVNDRYTKLYSRKRVAQEQLLAGAQDPHRPRAQRLRQLPALDDPDRPVLAREHGGDGQEQLVDEA